MRGPGKVDTLTGQRFTRLVVMQRLERVVGGFLCKVRCDCGTEKTVRSSNLISQHVKSCGCLNAELSATRNKKHGMRHTPEYRAYYSARARCTNPNVERFPEYGGRGIQFLFGSFEQFYADVGPKPTPKRNFSLDRIKVNGNYEPGNIRWATAKQQRHNQRRSAA